MTNINPCPFCGGEVILVQSDWNNPDAPRLTGHRLCYMACVNCKAYGPDLPTREESIAAWNSRSTAPAATVTGWRPEWGCLGIGDVTQEGDEVYNHFQMEWQVIEEQFWGKPITELSRPVRRRLALPAGASGDEKE